jgi:Arc-like DNA binding dprotein
VTRKGRPPRKSKRPGRDTVFFNLRLPEALRRDLEAAAGASGHSMNKEMVSRLTRSFIGADETAKQIAHALVRDLDGAVIEEIIKFVRQAEADSAAYDAWKEDQWGKSE